MADHLLDAGAAGTAAPVADDRAVDAPRTGAGGPAAFPPGPPHFAGRRRELRQLRADIDRPGLDALRGRPPRGCRVLLVAGRPGSGRTTLATRLAREVADRYPGGQFYARLTGGDGEPVPAARVAGELLRALGRPAAEDSEDGEEAPEALRAALAGRRVLLVLDDAAGTDQVLPLLPPDPDSLVVAVSRGPLAGIADVRPCTLGGLDTAACAELLARTIGPTRVSCDPTAAQRLAEECAGDPTALRLLSGWLATRPALSVSDAVRLLRETPDAVAAPGVVPSPAVRAFRLVHDALPQSTARALRLLAPAPGAVVDAQSAAALVGCSVDDARGLLADLARDGLLHPDPYDGPLPRRYRIPGCLHAAWRAVSEERARPGELRLARARLLERTVRLLASCRAAAEPEGSPARGHLAGLPRELRFPSAAIAGDWLRGRLPELLSAARMAAADGELDTLARRLVAALVRALDTHGLTDRARGELYELHGLLLDVAERRRLPREKAAALINLADLDVRAGRTGRAQERYRAALDAARQVGDGYAAARALESLAAVYEGQGDTDRAADWYGRALALRLSRGEPEHQARLHARLGALHADAGRPGDAVREWRAAAAVHRRLRDLPGQVRALAAIGAVQGSAGGLEESLRTYQEALDRAREAGDGRLEGEVLLSMAETLERLGDPAGAALQRAAAQPLLGWCAPGGPQPAA